MHIAWLEFKYDALKHVFRHITYTVEPFNTGVRAGGSLPQIYAAQVAPLIESVTGPACKPRETGCVVNAREIECTLHYRIGPASWWLLNQFRRYIRVSLTEHLDTPEQSSIHIIHGDTSLQRHIQLYRGLLSLPGITLSKKAQRASERIEIILADHGVSTQAISDALRVAAELNRSQGAHAMALPAEQNRLP